jgi:hypothetical protein
MIIIFIYNIKPEISFVKPRDDFFLALPISISAGRGFQVEKSLLSRPRAQYSARLDIPLFCDLSSRPMGRERIAAGMLDLPADGFI